MKKGKRAPRREVQDNLLLALEDRVRGSVRFADANVAKEFEDRRSEIDDLSEIARRSRGARVKPDQFWLGIRANSAAKSRGLLSNF